MRPGLKRIGVIFVIVCMMALSAEMLKGKDNYMEKLPLYRQFKCIICHQSSQPVSGMDLNNFGKDFKSNSHQWNATIAKLDSDGDEFTNGIELGDEDGNGVPEVSIERSNPGDPYNHPSSIDPKTWSIIKHLFAEDRF